MADKNSTGAVHLTSLDLDISGIKNSLQTIKESIETTAQEIPRIFNSSMSDGETIDWLKNLGISDENLESAKSKIKELADDLGNFSKIQVTSKEGNLFQAIVTYADKAGNSIKEVIDLTKELNEASKSYTITEDISKREKEYDRQQKAIEKQIEQTYKEYEAFKKAESKKNAEIAKGVAKRNAEREKEEAAAEKLTREEERFIKETEKQQESAIQKLESLGNAYEKLLNQVQTSSLSENKKNYFIKFAEDAQSAIAKLKQELSSGFGIPAGTEKQINAISDVLKKVSKNFEDAKRQAEEFSKIQKNINGVIKKISELEKNTSNIKIKQSTKELKKEFQNLYNEVKSGSISINDANTRFNNLSNNFENLRNNAQKTGIGIADFFNKISDKVKWLTAYQLIMLIQNAFSQIISTIKSTEDAVVELQRVLNEDISETAISDELYAIAEQYGQTFENVQEVAVKFAQTGKSWQETIDATRATMLGLNTAELEVTTATEGLIAVMAQFNVDASELEVVIDKINITADNFPVTSEKIVAALQRAGGTASAFNMTLEETIAIITALAEKTGRSGENIGTALNSLIIFTSKAENLKLFSSLSEDMDETVRKFQAGSRSIIDIWTQLGEEIDDLSKQQEEALFSSTAFEEFADQFEAEAAEYAGTIQQIYGTAGAYRRNYLTILLQDIDRVEKVMSNMADAEGYSLEENEKYMNTLTAQWNQLVIAAQELAVQFGNAGFLNILKDVVQLTTGILKLTKGIGGLNTLLKALTTAIIIAKKEKINEHIDNVKKSVNGTTTAFKSIKLAITAYNTAVKSGKTATEAYAIAMNTLKLSMGDLTAIIGIAITAISAMVSAYNSAKEAAKQYREEAIQAGKDSEQSAKELSQMYSTLTTSSNKEDIDEATNAILEYFGYQFEDIPKLEKEYGNLNSAIQALIENEYQLLKIAAQRRKEAAEKQYSDLTKVGDLSLTSYSAEAGSNATKAFDILANAVDSTGKKIFSVNESVKELGILFVESLKKIPKSSEEAKLQFQELEAQIKILQDNMTSKELAQNPLYASLIATKSALGEMIKESEAADEAYEDLWEKTSTGAEYMALLAENTKKAQEALDSAKDSAEGFSNIDLEEEIENLGDRFDTLSKKVDSFQSAISSIVGVIDEYNETGIMTADMLQTILSLEPEYIQMLNVQGESLSFNSEAVGNLVNANDTYLEQMVALKVAKEAEAMATAMQTAMNDGLTASEYAAGVASLTFGSDLYQTILNVIQGKVPVEELTNAFTNLGQAFALDGEYAALFNQNMTSVFNNLSSMLGMVNRGTTRTYYTPPKTSSSKTSPEKQRLNDEINAWKKKKEAATEYYKKLDDELKQQKEDSDKYYEKQITQWENEKKAKDDYYDSLIDNLKEVQEANDRINEQLDYYADRQKILTNLEQAQARSGVEWREKEMQYQQELINLDESQRRKEEDWSIEDQIAELEKMKETAQEIADTEIAKLKDFKDEYADLIKNQQEALKTMKENTVNAIEEEINKLQEQVNKLSNSASNSIGNSIANGAYDGAQIASDTFKNLIDTTETQIEEISDDIFEEVREKAKKSLDEYKNTTYESIKTESKELGKWVGSAIESGISDGAKKATQRFREGFVSPVKNEINQIMKEATSAQALVKASRSTIGSTKNIIPTVSKFSKQNTNSGYNNSQVVNLYANIANPTSASNTINDLTDILNNPNRF